MGTTKNLSDTDVDPKNSQELYSVLRALCRIAGGLNSPELYLNLILPFASNRADFILRSGQIKALFASLLEMKYAYRR